MRVLIFLLLSPIVVFSQLKIEGKVIDAVTKQPIPYVNLESFKYKTGTQSNQDGEFVLELAQTKILDTLKISSIGYQDKYLINVQSAGNMLLDLKPATIALEEVIIRKGKAVLREVGFVEDSGDKSSFFNHLMQRAGGQYAMLMKNEQNQPAYLKKVFFFIGKEGFDAPFRVRIYENLNGRPGADLLGISLELQGYKKKSWNEFDFAKYAIHVPENGIFVAIEWIANEKYKFEDSYGTKAPDGKRIKKTFNYYGPEIIKKMDTKYGLTYMKILGGKWGHYRAGASNGSRGFKYSGFADIMIKSTIEIIE